LVRPWSSEVLRPAPGSIVPLLSIKNMISI
jgi:hypothetical protein